MKSGSPKRSLNRRRAWLMAGCVRPRRSPAAVRLRRSQIAKNTRRRFRSRCSLDRLIQKILTMNLTLVQEGRHRCGTGDWSRKSSVRAAHEWEARKHEMSGAVAMNGVQGGNAPTDFDYRNAARAILPR